MNSRQKIKTKAEEKKFSAAQTGVLQKAKGSEATHSEVDQTLLSPGQPLEPTARTFIEQRFNQDFKNSTTDQSRDELEKEASDAAGKIIRTGETAASQSGTQHDFNQVRVHTSSGAAESTHALNARAYTVGNHIVFGNGEYRPNSSSGRELIAHELVHVAQQQHSPQTFIQCAGFFESIARFFGGGTFSEEELQDYLTFLRDNNRIEDSYDSDNKAREIVRRFVNNDAAFQNLTVPIRILLIREMASGYLSEDDQEGIVNLLEESITSERTTIIRETDMRSMRTRFDRRYFQRLDLLLDIQEFEEAEALRATGWTADGVMEIMHRHGDEYIIRTIIDQGIRVLKFDRGYDTWQYPDGTVQEEEVTGLRGNRRGNEIRIRSSLSNEEAASVLFHEVSHYTSAEPDYLEQEIQVRVATELFKIRHGLPATPGYRNPDGTVNEPYIRAQIMGSSHYNPVGRTRIGRRYEPDPQPEVTGWRLP